MLYEIEVPPAAQNAVILLHPEDNVAIARVSLPAGQELQAAGRDLVTRAAIPAGHKVALRHIAGGTPVYRYGNVIGFATTEIEPGEHVHTHNLSFRELDLSQLQAEDLPPRPERVSRSSFLGYQRADGRVGTRNYIAIVAASNCAAHTADLIASSFAEENLPPGVDGVVAFPHGEGCAQSTGRDLQQLQRTLEGVLDHPNVSAALILGLGCEVNQVAHYLGQDGSGFPREDSVLQGMTLQESGGTLSTVEQARQRIGRFIEHAAKEQRVKVPASKIVLGLNCGGSDSFSGITANPALGYCCDLIAEERCTVVLAETTKIIGA